MNEPLLPYLRVAKKHVRFESPYHGVTWPHEDHGTWLSFNQESLQRASILWSKIPTEDLPRAAVDYRMGRYAVRTLIAAAARVYLSGEEVVP